MTQRIKYRIKFSKTGRIRFIGHLDLLNVFQRCIKRAELPVAYSAGFNPHQEMSFALALSLGYYSFGDYIDVIFTEELDENAVAEKMNRFMPEGIEIIAVRRFAEGEKGSAVMVEGATYEVLLPEESRISRQNVDDFFNQETIMIMKKTKKKTEETDIKPDIITVELVENQNKLKLFLRAGASRSVRADSVVQALCEFSQAQYLPFKTKYSRMGLYKEHDGKYAELIG